MDISPRSKLKTVLKEKDDIVELKRKIYNFQWFVSLISISIPLLFIIISYIILKNDIYNLTSILDLNNIAQYKDLSNTLDSLKAKKNDLLNDNRNIQFNSFLSRMDSLYQNQKQLEYQITSYINRIARLENQLRNLDSLSFYNYRSFNIKKSPFLIFGDFEKRSINETYRETTDGIVIANISSEKSGSIGQIIGSVRSSDTIQYEATASINLSENDVFKNNSFIMPVKRGDRWRVTSVKLQGFIDINIIWLPIFLRSAR